MNTTHQAIDSLQFCLRNQALAGEFATAALPRLMEELAAESGSVRYALQGGRIDGRPCLSLQVDAGLVLPCQRCGQGMAVSVHSESRVLIARDEEELAAWEAEHILLDALVADARLVVADLVEDEVMLSLPISPRHADGECAIAQ